MRGDLFANLSKAPKLDLPRLSLAEEIAKYRVVPQVDLRRKVAGKTYFNNPCDWWRVNKANFPIDGLSFCEEHV